MGAQVTKLGMNQAMDDGVTKSMKEAVDQVKRRCMDHFCRDGLITIELKWFVKELGHF
jgi:hypothetical protein